MDDLRNIVSDLAANLEYEREEGRRTAHVDPAVCAALAGKQLPPAPDVSIDTPDGLADVAREVAACSKCPLHAERTHAVPGQGHPAPAIMFVGEGPGADEDQQGIAFIGRAGQLLTKMIQAMGLTRDDVFIGNIVKCRPPDNRQPLPKEMEACLPYLKRQIALLQPRVIVALGATAVKGLLGTTTGITCLRGQWHSFDGIDVMPTYHPAYLLRTPAAKKEAWEDLKAVLRRLDMPIPPVQKAR